MNRYNKSFYLFHLLNYAFIVFYFAYNSVGVGPAIFVQLALILLYILNSQLRFFMLFKYPGIYYLSLLAEAGLAALLYHLVGGFWFAYIAILLFDLSIYLPPKRLMPFFVSACGFSVAVLVNIDDQLLAPVYSLALNLANICLVSLFGFYLRQESIKKDQAQVLYDKLRVSEDELQQAYHQLQGYSATIKELAILRERHRISRELHDSVGHSISTLIIQLEAIKAASKQNSAQTIEMLENLIRYTKDSMENVRRTVRDMKPLELEDDSGLIAIDRLLDTFKSFTMINTQLIVSKDRWPLSSSQSHNLYRIVQEALNNSAKHSKADKIVVSMNYAEDKLQLRIRDNGVGCLIPNSLFGLSSIRERVSEHEGTMHITTAPNQGFEIFITIPREEKAYDQPINS